MGFLRPLLFLALCVTPSGKSNIFPVAKLWYANRSVQNADCRPATKCRLQTEEDCCFRLYDNML